MTSFTTRPELLGRHGMVASTHWLASAAGMAMLEAGGNAADAAVAAGFVLQVVEPHLNGLGGDAPILVAGGGDSLPDVVCGQGPTPRLATIDRFKGLGLEAVPGSGLLAACVPGAFDAWMVLLRDRGTMSLAQVLAPAIDYAANGYPVLPQVAATIGAAARMFREEWPTSAALYLPGGDAPRPGTLFSNPALAATYGALVAAGSAAAERVGQIDGARAAFYRGFVAAAIDRFCQQQVLLDGSGGRHAGLLRGEDLAAWSAGMETPVALEYAGHLVCKCGPWSQGPVLLQQLAMLRVLGIETMPAGGAEWVHHVVEVAKLAFADRDAWYGDPEEGAPIADLLDPGYSAQRAGLVDTTPADWPSPGTPGGRAPRMPRLGPLSRVLGAGAGDPTLAAGPGDTCHLDVADRWGMMVSATPSGGWLQSSPVIPELGFCLGTRTQMTWMEDGLSASLRPGRRPRTTLSPTMVMRGGRPVLAMGTPGGDQQDQWQLTVLLRHLHGEPNLQAAIDAPAFHTTRLVSSFAPRNLGDNEIAIEPRFGGEVLDALRAMGHRLAVTDPWALGRVSAVGRRDDGTLTAGANPRGMQGYAAGR